MCLCVCFFYLCSYRKCCVGTGDIAELMAVKSVLCDDEGLSPCDVVVTANKSSIGHLLGAAGAVEAIASILGLHTVCFS